MKNYDQVLLQPKMIDGPDFMKDGMDVDIMFHAEKEIPLSVSLPAHMVLEVVYTEPGVRECSYQRYETGKTETGF